MAIDAPKSNYLSDGEIMAWMESKTEGMYGIMRSAMDTADQRTELESELGDLKATLAGVKDNKLSMQDAESTVASLIAKYQAFPEVVGMLQPMDDALKAALHPAPWQPSSSDIFQSHTPPPSGVTHATLDAWCSQIDDKLSYLGKQDQLGLITLGDMNSQINQTKQIASNLIDGINKSSSAIIANLRV